MGLSQNVKTHSGSPRFLRKINKKKNRRQNLTAEWDNKAEVGEKSTSFVVYSFEFYAIKQSFFQTKTVRNDWN